MDKRGASYLLPDPGGEVVRGCLDEIEKLREALEGLLLYVDAKNKVLVAYRLGSHAIVNRALNSLAKLGNKKAKARKALGVI